jgi:uncharacterized protein YkwD
MSRTAGVVMILVFSAFFSPPASACQKNQQISPPITEIQAMEKEIWMLLNKERAFDNLPPLQLSSALSDLARKHSQDMADSGRLSHRSSDGKTLSKRLEEAGIFFIEAGENVARSETFVAEIIHDNLVESPEHRENILDPDFKEIGIGIVYKKNRGYYVTQDFLLPLIPQTDQDVKRIIRHDINSRRRSRSLPPLVFLENRENFAENLSIRKSKGRELLPIPEVFGETLVIFLATPSLSHENVMFQDAVNPRYDRAALGIWFAKNNKYPGGAYFLTLLLFAANKYNGWSQEDQKKTILTEINRLRAQKGLKRLRLDERLNEAAERLVSKIAGKRGSEMGIFPEYRRYEILTFGTTDLKRLPDSLPSRMANTRLRRIGIGVLFIKNSASPEGAFWVALLFE